MTPSFDKVHKRFKYNGLHFSHRDLKEVAYSLVKEGEPHERGTGDFLLDWLDDKDHLLVKTSGSTGIPKDIKLMKQAMVNSAIATGDFFKLEPGDKAIGCLPSHFIAGKMMLVRAMILGLEIDVVEPTARPFFNYNTHYQFCAMTPLQVSNTLDQLLNIDTIIIGGSKVTKALGNQLSKRPNQFFETYGMTETITHVAVKQLKSIDCEGQDYFHALPNVTFDKDSRGCLLIHAPKLIEAVVVTNDIIDLKNKQAFKWIGRFDNVVNSAGIKLYPEQIEDKLQHLITERYMVAGIENRDLGEQLVLVVENTNLDKKELLNKMEKNKDLSKFEVPKLILTLDKFEETINGKVQRRKTLTAALDRNLKF